MHTHTGEFHNENNCAYTIITIPKRDSSNDPPEYNFVSQIMMNHNVGIKLERGMTFYSLVNI